MLIVLGCLVAPVLATFGTVSLNYGGTGSLTIGGTSVVTVSVNTGSNKINGVDLGFTFDKSKLEVVAIEPVLRSSGATNGVNQPMFRGSNNVLTSYAGANLTTINSSGTFTLKGISLLFTSVGDSLVPGESVANAVANLSTGTVDLFKVSFKEKGVVGQATLGLDKTYGNKVTGYNVASDDQELALTDFGTATDNTFKIGVAGSALPVCVSSNGGGTMPPGGSVTVTMTADKAMDSGALHVYNKESGKMAMLNGKNFVIKNGILSTDKKMVTYTINYSDLAFPDEAFGDAYMKNIQLNGLFFIGTSNSGYSGNCVKLITLEPRPEPACVVLKLDGSQPANCELRSKGDADCNGKIEPADYSIWRKEFYLQGAGTTARNNWMANFSCSSSKQKVDITDFNIWRNSCTQKIGQPGVTEKGACVL